MAMSRTFFTSRRRCGSEDSNSEMLSAWISITLSAIFTSLIPLLLCASLNAEAPLLTLSCHAETYGSVERGPHIRAAAWQALGSMEGLPCARDCAVAVRKP
jgi:hypothetical protein